MRLAWALMLCSCADVVTGARGPISPLERFGTYKNAVEYEVEAARVVGEACYGFAVRNTTHQRTKDSSALINGYLFEKAKMLALDTAKDADGLIEIRSTYVIGADGNECIKLSGRPYRVVAMRAIPQGAATAPEEKPKPTHGVVPGGLMDMGASDN